GDVVREMLSSGLTFTKPDRELNLRRIGFVAGEVTRHGGICVCAVIAPYASARAEARARIEPHGGFYEIYVSTPLAVCEDRDNKGLYARARRGEIRGFTGIDDPYEPPKNPDLSIDSSRMSLDEEVQRILALPRRDRLL
ncbi:MAG TPA: adenylyl-sulfate kinase, partial [Nevskiaceae bacterium]|nr:adenylyl-sulfate kinase [Nevskiaceae bacterium]